MEILHFEDLGDTECRLAANAVVLVPGVSNFNSKVPQGDIYPHIKFERDRLNIFRVKSVHIVRVYRRTRRCGVIDANIDIINVLVNTHVN